MCSVHRRTRRASDVSAIPFEPRIASRPCMRRDASALPQRQHPAMTCAAPSVIKADTTDRNFWRVP